MTYDLEKLERLLGYGICHGAGKGGEGDVCVEQAVALCSGEVYTTVPTDKPSCTNRDIAACAIGLNDSPGWASNEARARGLRRLAYAQLGTAEIPFDMRQWRRDVMPIMDVVKEKADCLGVSDLIHAPEYFLGSFGPGEISLLYYVRSVSEKLPTPDASRLLGMVADMMADAIRKQGFGYDPPGTEEK